jgi:hypothetical protein
MSETAQKLFQGLAAAKDAALAVAPGLKNLGPQLGAEVSRLGTQGSMELASMLFNGQERRTYGPGQYTPDQSHEQAHSQPQQTQAQERGGMER